MTSRSMGAVGWKPARRNVIAMFKEMRDARAAIDALEANGFDAGSISVEGQHESREREDTRGRDAGVSRFMGARVVAGIAVGGAIGMAIALLIVGLTARADPIPLLLAGVAGAVGGGSIGMMIAGVGSLDVTPDWELTFESDRSGPIVVAVGSEDPQAAQTAVEVLHDLEPVSMKEVDASGRPL